MIIVDVLRLYDGVLLRQVGDTTIYQLPASGIEVTIQEGHDWCTSNGKTGVTAFELFQALERPEYAAQEIVRQKDLQAAEKHYQQWVILFGKLAAELRKMGEVATVKLNQAQTWTPYKEISIHTLMGLEASAEFDSHTGQLTSGEVVSSYFATTQGFRRACQHWYGFRP